MRSDTAIGVRGELDAEDLRCHVCALPLAASPIIERIAGPLVSTSGRPTAVEIEFLFGQCVCGAGWGFQRSAR